MSILTADLCDKHPDFISTGEIRVLHPIFRAYGKKHAFHGRISTVKVFEDNVLVRRALEEEGDGRVLFVDGGASYHCALLGGNLARLANTNGWVGIVVNGCVRDVDEINTCNIGARALGSHPLKSNKRGQGERDVPIYIAGSRILPGEWCYADNDGILISPKELHLTAKE